MIKKNNFYIITGGPGVGKTTLLKELKKRGFNCIREVARDIIIEQMKTNGNALPWKDSLKYKELMLEKSILDFIHSENKKITFFDRAIPDTICYSKVLNTSLTNEEKFAVNNYKYNKKVFLLPPWKEIYTIDNERKQDWEEAILTYRLMKETYLECEYQIFEIPKLDVKSRANIIIKNIFS